jgi:2,3-bisphosphoglycerate-dependent phosphoglycerate mutase
MKSRWPERLWIVRHGESAGNVARDLAHANRAARIDIGARDVDVPLSARGNAQASALGDWFAHLAEDERPQVVLSSPYSRAQGTAELIRNAGGLAQDSGKTVLDERLREREFGILDRLTSAGIREFHPEQAELRRAIGKFYHRPPGGESWCDVILRLRSALDTVSLHYPRKRVLVVAHQVVVLCLRYLIEGLTEAELMGIDAQGDVVNCGVTEYCFDPRVAPDGALRLVRYNFAAPLERRGAPVTSSPDAPVAAR